MEEPNMDRYGLREVLRREGVRDETYVLEGEDYSENLGSHPSAYTGIYVLRAVEDGWEVFGFERGDELSKTFFATEDEACSELLMRLLNDPATRESGPNR
jgi:hypothetical protein